jgi:DNA-binding MarR family transcriptional regulator
VPESTPSQAEIPTLLRLARGGYGNTISSGLARAGFDDLPRNGPFLLSCLAAGSSSVAGLIRGLGVSRQAASQLVDTMVLRGYLIRAPSAGDRRRITIELTDRGRAAAAEIAAATRQVDDALAQMLSPGELAGLRAGLLALGKIRERTEDDRPTSHL